MRLVRLCSVCRQEHDFWRRDMARAGVALIGAAPYAPCCCCGQQVGDLVTDRGYRSRFNRYARRQKAQARYEEEKRRQEQEREEAADLEAEAEDARIMYGRVKD